MNLKFELVDEAKDLQHRLSQLNPIIRDQRMKASAQEAEGFDRCFRVMAKQMLAGPVYERLMLAARQRFGDDI